MGGEPVSSLTTRGIGEINKHECFGGQNLNNNIASATPKAGLVAAHESNMEDWVHAEFLQPPLHVSEDRDLRENASAALVEHSLGP
mmetsp:Transcript_85106/g.190234  ORF Transcript_85106/g.190234 Transcript_85106/m.190234 type:complete len:86 (+) Transcript_85106:88-345(+)